MLHAHLKIYHHSKRHFLVVPFPSMYRTIFVSHYDELTGMSDVQMVQIFLGIYHRYSTVRNHYKENDARSDEITGFSYEKDIRLSGCPFAPVATYCMYRSTRYNY